MGQSLLIDMNSGWYKHKTEVNEGIKIRNYNQVNGALAALNALLPDKYRVIIDNEEYNQKIQGNLVALCNHCTSEYEDQTNEGKMVELPTQNDVNKIKKYHLFLSNLDRVATGQKYDDFWKCESCKKINRLRETKFKQIILRKPFYLQVVPEPPKQKMGIEDRNVYHVKFELWARNFLAELNAQAQKFREEYKPKAWEMDQAEIDFGKEEF